MLAKILQFRFTTALPFISQNQFAGEAALLLHRLEKSFNNLKQYEDRLEISESGQSLKVSVKDFGEYNFKYSLQDRLVYYQSPYQMHKYYYDETSDNWVCVKDKHLLIECLTRETGKYLKGYLEI